MKGVIRSLDLIFSAFVLFVILVLVLFMAARLSIGAYILIIDLFSGTFFHEVLEGESSLRALHAIAETVILIKAYRILVSYLKTHHISVEYIVEISIIAPAIELLFAHKMYDTPTLIILAVFGLANLFMYLHFFGPQHDEELHESRRHHKH